MRDRAKPQKKRPKSPDVAAAPVGKRESWKVKNEVGFVKKGFLEKGVFASCKRRKREREKRLQKASQKEITTHQNESIWLGSREFWRAWGHYGSKQLRIRT